MDADLCFGFSKTMWEKLSQKLDGTDENAWTQAIGVFERRMRERFFSSIDVLFVSDTKPDLSPSDSTRGDECIPGFAIIALCCLLIEALEDFLEDPPARAILAGSCTFPSGPCIQPPAGTNQRFKKFLRRPAFGGAFSDEVAQSFTWGIRNGILHNAETRKWVIWREAPGGKIVAQEDDGYALNRSLFYAALQEEFESYLQELRDPAKKELRQRFKEKMDRLSGKA